MRAFLDAVVELCPDAKLNFETRVGYVNDGTFRTAEGQAKYDLVLGCDGVKSLVRESFEKECTIKPIKF